MSVFVENPIYLGKKKNLYITGLPTIMQVFMDISKVIVIVHGFVHSSKI